MKKRKKLILLLVLIMVISVKVYAKESIPENLDKEWYCNIVKGNAINNYFKLPSIEKGLNINREDYETNADFEDAIDYYNLENYRITLNFKAKNKVDIGWTSLLYNNNYKDSQNVTKSFTYSLNGNEGVFTSKKDSYPFSLANDIINIPSQNVVCYANLIEAQKNYKLYELNENFDKSIADDEGFVINNGVLTKYIGTKRKLLFPSTITEIAKFDSDNVYYFSTLVIPSNVQKVDDKAFEYLNTEEVVFSEGVKEIGNDVFLDANYIDVYLPSSITSIGTKAFGNNTSEKTNFHVVKNSFAENYLKINYPQNEINIIYDYNNSNSIVKETKDYVNYSYKEIKSFINSEGFAIRNNILYACSKNASNVIIPNNITTIASEAFSDYYNSKVKKIIVPESVKKVEYNAFAFTSAKTLVFDKGLKTIESQAFSDTSFKDVYLPPTIEKIGKDIFSTDEGLNGTNFHVKKDSNIAKYLESNPPKGKFKIKYDYEKAEELIANSSKLTKFKILIIAAIITSLIAIIILIIVAKGDKNDSKKTNLIEKKHNHRLKSLNNNITTNEENKDEIYSKSNTEQIIENSTDNEIKNNLEASENYNSNEPILISQSELNVQVNDNPVIEKEINQETPVEDITVEKEKINTLEKSNTFEPEIVSTSQINEDIYTDEPKQELDYNSLTQPIFTIQPESVSNNEIFDSNNNEIQNKEQQKEKEYSVEPKIISVEDNDDKTEFTVEPKLVKDNELPEDNSNYEFNNIDEDEKIAFTIKEDEEII